jgi:hypothetical protein
MASNTGTTAGLLSKTDYDAFNTKLGTTTSFAGDVSGTYNSTIVQKIQGKAITAGSVSGQMMIYNGTAWNNAVMSGDATMDYAGALTLAKVPVAKGGTNATTFGNNRIIASNGTGTALQNFTCSLNQVISFDASGNATCAAISSLGGFIVNGGNATGADISIGTTDNKAFSFMANNTIAMTISQGGKVGIGVANPAQALEVNGNVKVNNTITTASTELVLEQTGDASGTTRLRMRNRTGSNGAIFENAAVDLVDFGFVPSTGSGNQSNLRLEHRSAKLLNSSNTAGEFQFINTGASATLGWFASGPSATIINTGSVGIGISIPSSALDISGAMTAEGMSSAPSVSPSNTGRIYYDFSANKFKVSQNGAAYVDLVASGGITSLGGQTGATQTLAISVDNSVALPTITSATNAHTWKIPMASNTGTTAGLLNKTDYDSFVAKLGTSTVFAGDVSGTYNATSVDKIKGKAITAGSVSGQMMIYNGTAWNNAVMSGDATMDYAGALTLAKVPVSKGGTNATSFGNNRIIASNSTGTTLQDFTCSLNQVISFDASGNSVCANVSSLITAIVNGGNTTGADISIGTNDNKALAFKVNNTTAVTISQSGNIGVGTNAPRTALDVSGAIVSRPALSVAAGTVDFASNNLSYTSQNCRAFALYNLKDGGSYTLAVFGTTSALCSFTAYSDAGSTALTLKLPPDHTWTLEGKSTVYTFVVLGTTVIASWIPGY